MLSYEMEKEISDSWSRCIAEGLNPFQDPKQSVISSIELNKIKEKNETLRKIVLPELELLYSQIAGTNFMVAYSDENGLVLDTMYDKTCLQTKLQQYLKPFTNSLRRCQIHADAQCMCWLRLQSVRQLCQFFTRKIVEGRFPSFLNGLLPAACCEPVMPIFSLS